MRALLDTPHHIRRAVYRLEHIEHVEPGQGKILRLTQFLGEESPELSRSPTTRRLKPPAPERRT